MNKIKDQKNLDKKKVLLRLDLNVPLKKGLITDETRINKIIPIKKESGLKNTPNIKEKIRIKRFYTLICFL